jgi:hypothetical protein
MHLWHDTRRFGGIGIPGNWGGPLPTWLVTISASRAPFFRVFLGGFFLAYLFGLSLGLLSAVMFSLFASLSLSSGCKASRVYVDDIFLLL